MKKVDGFYLYNIGSEIREVKALKGDYKNDSAGTKYSEAFHILYSAEKALEQFLEKSDFPLKTSRLKGDELKKKISDLFKKIREEEDKNKRLLFRDVYTLHDALDSFEAVVASEFAYLDLYIITKKGGYDISDLMLNGEVCFPKELFEKVPEAIADIRAGTKCIAVSLPTAAGFHLHRANEAVLRRYWDAVTDGAERPKNNNMGQYLSRLEDMDAGNPAVRSALKDLKDLHRNPLIHPDHTLDNIDEAIALMNNIHTVIVYMLKQIPKQENNLSSTLAKLISAA